MLSPITRAGWYQLPHSWYGLYRVQVQVLLLDLAVVLLGQHSLLWTLSQTTVCGWLRLAQEIEWAAQVPGQGELPTEDITSTERDRVLAGVRSVSQQLGEHQELLIQFRIACKVPQGSTKRKDGRYEGRLVRSYRENGAEDKFPLTFNLMLLIHSSSVHRNLRL